jgi:HAD superfamily hydrolase (TIGR01509 family)
MRGLLFDLDGTLVDTDRIHEEAWRRVLRPWYEVDHRFYQEQISGALNPEILLRLLPDLPPEEAQALLEAKESLFRSLAQELQPLPGAREFLTQARQQGLRLGLVTNAPRANVDHVLSLLGIGFSLIIRSEELPRGKPDPLPYQVALNALGLPAQEVWAFEDSPSGIRSARGAGLTTVGVASGHSEEALKEAGASWVIQDFQDPRLIHLWEHV